MTAEHVCGRFIIGPRVRKWHDLGQRRRPPHTFDPAGQSRLLSKVHSISGFSRFSTGLYAKPVMRLRSAPRRHQPGVGTRAVRDRMLRSNGAGMLCGMPQPAGRRSDLKASGRCCSLSQMLMPVRLMCSQLHTEMCFNSGSGLPSGSFELCDQMLHHLTCTGILVLASPN